MIIIPFTRRHFMGRTLNQNNSNKGGNNSVIGTNPVIRKLSKVAE